jgi:signal transduction histidine kinase
LAIGVLAISTRFLRRALRAGRPGPAISDFDARNATWLFQTRSSLNRSPILNAAGRRIDTPGMEDDAPGLDPAVAGELVQLEALRRMALGAAHAWNNALTAILGDVRWLLEERAGDPAVARACRDIEREAQRCARLTRALQARGAWRSGEPGEVDLGALAEGLAPVLRETVSSSVELAWEVPERTPWVRGRRADAELLVLLAAQALVRDAPGGSVLRIALGKPVDRHVDVSLECRSPEAEPREPRPRGSWDALVERAARSLAGAADAEWSVDLATGRARLRFACA